MKKENSRIPKEILFLITITLRKRMQPQGQPMNGFYGQIISILMKKFRNLCSLNKFL